MRKILTLFTGVALCVFAAQVEGANYRYSVDLGGDLDLSDPNDPANPNAFMDCGAIYVENMPTLVKDDDNPALPYVGHPLPSPNGGPQPAPAQVGTSNIVDYQRYFDLDAEDQLAFEIIRPTALVQPPAAAPGGLYLEPTRVDFSYEDDGPAGWAVTGDVPVNALQDHGTATAKDEVMIDTGPFGTWSPLTVTGVRDEAALGMANNPPPQTADDDVDALDIEQHRYFFWSADHEACIGPGGALTVLDPGDIYMTDLGWAGQNMWLAVDDVANIGLINAGGGDLNADVDAWEFCVITRATYMQYFGMDPQMDQVVVGLFSIDGDDPDTTSVDESGGLNPNKIYMTNLIGLYVGLATYQEDIDALTVPEPATLSVLALGALALIRRRKR